MGLLSNTNIIVDDFMYGKVREAYGYIYFLSHMHSGITIHLIFVNKFAIDHYQGLTNEWDYGMIYCTTLTKRVLLNKFPMLKNVIALDYNKEYEIFLNKTKTIKYKVTLFDANHIAGSAMFLFDGPLGTFFHTGDSRFDDYMFDDYKILFPNNLGQRDFIPIEEGAKKF